MNAGFASKMTRLSVSVEAGMVLLGVLMTAMTVPVMGAPPDEPAANPEQEPAATSEPPAPRAPLPPPGFLPGCLELIKQKRFAEARMLLEPVVADHPGWARAHLALGLTYRKEHRNTEALPYFARALELDPQQDATRIPYGWCLYSLGEIEAARRMFDSYPKRKTGFAEASFALGLIAFDGDQLDQATDQFETAVKLASLQKNRQVEAKSRAGLADVLTRRGDLDGASRQLRRSLELNSDNADVWFKLSRVLDRLGDADGALIARQRHAEALERSSVRSLIDQ